MKKFILTVSVCLLGMSSFSSCNDSNEPSKPIENGEVDLSAYSNKVILDWNLTTMEALLGPAYPLPPVNTRVNSMVHLAMHDALNSVYSLYDTYVFNEGVPGADPIAAAASAAYEVLVVNFPDHKEMLDQKLSVSLAEVKNEEAKIAGIELGKKAAMAILELRENDEALQDPLGPVDTSDIPGVYQKVPPFDFIYAPFWKDMAPFSLERPEQFRNEPFPPLNSQQYADDFEEVKRIGQKDSPYRTEDESFLAKYWYEFSELGWNRIARIVASDKKLDLFSTGRLFALLNIAIADAYIAGWDGKFYYNHWRPFTAIRALDDGNDMTERDATWEAAEPTPPVQDYPSTHSAVGNAAASVLAYIFGDDTHFTMQSSTAVPVEQVRSFDSFSEAADENALSRILAGIHFRSACSAGQKLGDDVGAWVVSNSLKPVQKTADAQ